MFLYNDLCILGFCWKTYGEKINNLNGTFPKGAKLDQNSVKYYNQLRLEKERDLKLYIKSIKLTAHQMAERFDNYGNYLDFAAIGAAYSGYEPVAFVTEVGSLGMTGMKHLMLFIADENSLQQIVVDGVMQGTEFCPNKVNEKILDFAIPNTMEYLEENYR